MQQTKFLKIVHPEPEDIQRFEEFLELASKREPKIGPVFAEIRELVEQYPENELFYWKMATFVAFSFYKKSEEQLVKVSMGQPTGVPENFAPKAYATTTMPPRAT